MSTYNDYCEHYRPLVDEFVDEIIKKVSPKECAGIPELFLPAWGKHYEESLTKIAFVGRDTYGWGDGIDAFADRVKAGQWETIFNIKEFQDKAYLKWGTDNRYHFWGFVLYFLAWMYGLENWEMLKNDKTHSDILSSFAWGNANSIERWDSKSLQKYRSGLGQKQRQQFGLAYDIVKRASRKFDSIDHLKRVLNPDVVFVMCEVGDCRQYLGRHFEESELIEERVESASLRIFEFDGMLVINIPHPQGIMFRHDEHKAEYFAEALREILKRHGKYMQFRKEFFVDGQMAEQFLATFMKKLDPSQMSTRDATVKIAIELRKQDACMTVEKLCSILNAAGFRTKLNFEYSGGRGAYRMLSHFYYYFDDAQKGDDPDAARAIAEAFKRSDGTYAYE